jgi:hypothetical protein
VVNDESSRMGILPVRGTSCHAGARRSPAGRGGTPALRVSVPSLRPASPPPNCHFYVAHPHPLPSCLPVSLDIDFAATYHHGVG